MTTPHAPSAKADHFDDSHPPEVSLMQLTAFEEAETLGAPIPCRSLDPEVFFAESPADVECAKLLCRGCPARMACLAGALERREPWGVWGGELFLRGEIVPRKRPRGRPRKDEVAA